MASVTGLFVYPVKSAKGIRVSEAHVGPTGLAYDRHWVIVQDENGKFETQRKDPRIALIETAIPEAALTGHNAADHNLTIKVPGQEPLKIPLKADGSKKRRRCKVWDWDGEGLDEGDEAAEYLSSFLGTPVRLIRYAGEPQIQINIKIAKRVLPGNPEEGIPDSEITRRQLDRDFAPDNSETAFADAMPILLANEASLDELASRCPERIVMNRFRPNVVVRGSQAWEEDKWAELRIGSLPFELNMPNGRCPVTTVNQTTAERSQKLEPLRTLNTYRTGKVLGWDADRKWRGLPFFGWYILPSQSGSLLVGDEVIITKEREGPPQMYAKKS